MTFQDDNGNYIVTGGSFAMTKQAISIFNSEIQGDVSVNFSVDSNSENRKTLNYYGPQMNTQVAFTRQVFKRLDDSGNILDRGYIVIQDDTGDSLDCFYVSGNSNWIQSLQGLITQLNWSDYSVKFTITNVTTTLKNAVSGIVFPVADWTSNLKAGYPMKYLSSVASPRCDINNNKNKSILDFYPCLYLSTLVQECLVQNGIKLSGNLLDDPLFKSLAVSPVNADLKRNTFNSVSLIGSSQAFVANGAGEYNPTNTYKNYTTVSDPDGIVNVSSGVITPNVTKTLQFKITVTASTVFPINVAIFTNGAVTSAPGFNFAGDSQVRTVTMNKGDTFTIQPNWLSVGVKTASVNIIITTPDVITINDWVDPGNFLPALNCIDIVKFIVSYFGCSVYYDTYSSTLSLNIIENITRESALDWSDYYISHRSEYTVQSAQNNYLRLDQDDSDSGINSYNAKNKKGYGEGLIQTGNTLKKEQDLFKIPFSATSFGLGINGIYESNIPLISFSDNGAGIAFSAFTDLGGDQVRVTWSGPDLDTTLYEVVRIVNSSGQNLGYFTANTNPLHTGTFDVYMAFKGTTSGTVYRQTANYNTIAPRLLVVRTGGNTFDFMSTLNGYFPVNSTGLTVNEDGSPNQRAGLPYAFFCKSKTGAAIDGFTANAALDNPNFATFKDQTIIERYFNKIGNILGNPTVRFQMLIPKAVYQSFDFSQFIYVKTSKITGYFFVQSITNYIDGKTPVEVNCYML